MKEASEIEAYFKSRGVNPNNQIISTCKLGVTACILNVSMDLLGNPDHRLYDGSWVQYSSVPEPEDNNK